MQCKPRRRRSRSTRSDESCAMGCDVCRGVFAAPWETRVQWSRIGLSGPQWNVMNRLE